MKRLKRRLLERDVETHRREQCVSYEECLHKAAMEKWCSFSCEGCKHFQENEDRIKPGDILTAPAGFVYPDAAAGASLTTLFD